MDMLCACCARVNLKHSVKIMACLGTQFLQKFVCDTVDPCPWEHTYTHHFMMRNSMRRCKWDKKIWCEDDLRNATSRYIILAPIGKDFLVTIIGFMYYDINVVVFMPDISVRFCFLILVWVRKWIQLNRQLYFVEFSWICKRVQRIQS